MQPDRLILRTAWSLLALGLVLCFYPLIRAFYSFEIDYNEGWNLFWQTRAVAGEKLYSGAPPLMFNNYPPLSFHLIGVLGQLSGNTLLTGRLLSLGALGIITWACGAIIRDAGGNKAEQILGAATCLLLFACFATDYLGMNDPQLLASAFAVVALWLHLRGQTGGTTAALLVLALLTKHNIILLPLLIGLDVLRRGPRMSFLVAGVGAVLLAGLWVLSTEGTQPLAQILAPRTWQIDRAFLFTMEMLGKLQAPLAVVGIGLFVARQQRPAALILIWLIAALMLGAYFSGGAGTDINIWFDVMIALAIGSGLVLKTARERNIPPRWQTALALTIHAGTLFFVPQALGRFGVEMAGDMTAREAGWQADVAWLKSQPGAAICQSQLLCLQAGKPLLVDPFNTTQAVHILRLPGDTWNQALASSDTVQISDRPQKLPDDPPGGRSAPARFENFPDQTFIGLEETYRLVRVGENGRFYRRTLTNLLP